VQEAKIEALEVRSWFDKIVVLGDEDRLEWKPSRLPFDRWLEGSTVGSQASIYLADNPVKDFLGARRAGWASIRVRRSDGLHRDEEPATAEARPDWEISDLESLSLVLERVEAAA
jgi:putative hydrolase of the HAD superfamily